VTAQARAERTARLLVSRLEEFAAAAERVGLPAADLARLLELASTATLHAVALELLPHERAVAIWADAAERHPALASAPALARAA
jgi:hypothetical protein